MTTILGIGILVKNNTYVYIHIYVYIYIGGKKAYMFRFRDKVDKTV